MLKTEPLTLDEPVPTTLLDDVCLCVCGYSKREPKRPPLQCECGSLPALAWFAEDDFSFRTLLGSMTMKSFFSGRGYTYAYHSVVVTKLAHRDQHGEA